MNAWFNSLSFQNLPNDLSIHKPIKYHSSKMRVMLILMIESCKTRHSVKVIEFCQSPFPLTLVCGVM